MLRPLSGKRKVRCSENLRRSFRRKEMKTAPQVLHYLYALRNYIEHRDLRGRKHQRTGARPHAHGLIEEPGVGNRA
jgi:FAD synthase